MEKQQNHIGSLFEKAEAYLETKMELYRLHAIDKSTTIVSGIVARLIIALFIASCFLMFSIGLAILIGRSMGEMYYGFFIVAGFYLVVIIVLYASRDKWLKAPVSNLIIKSIFN
ncbi:MAG TPA: hypothetical protein VK559_08315 [Ferruginibacter sp.]|nr:hypothetical protein [Ferruginibacter sp.]